MLFLRAEEETSGWGGAGKGSFLEGSICNQGLEEVWGLDGQLEHGDWKRDRSGQELISDVIRILFASLG